MSCRFVLIPAVVALLFPAFVGAETVESDIPVPPAPKIRWEIDVSPMPIRLNAANRRQQIVVTVKRGGRDVDVTRDATIELASNEVATVTGSVVNAKKDGKTRLKVRYGKEAVEILVAVENASTFPPVHFVNDVVPLFSKLGCNSGGCHGKASGQNGFKLSVFGFDPHADFASLSRESRGRRVFTGDPERSLLILKAIGASAHGGGRRCEPGSPDHELLSNWIRQGMPWGDDSAPTVQSVRVFPTSR
ncbi:MAG: S-layer protein, partial [Planctomycetes bacterium]|nr:S-layer protein [Planctomycetota bacterium]